MLGFLSDVSGCDIRVNWIALKAVGVSQNTSVSMTLRYVTFTEALSLILSRTGRDVRFAVNGSKITVSTYQDLFGSRGVGWRIWTSGSILLIGIFCLMIWDWRELHRPSDEAPPRRWRTLMAAAVCATAVALLTVLHGVPTWKTVLGSLRFTVTAQDGLLRIWSAPADPFEPYYGPANRRVGSAATPDQDGTFEHLGFFIRRSGFPFNAQVIGIPLWEAVSLSSIAPVIWLALMTRVRHFAPGHCQQCGYDLTGNVSGVCPECGTPVPAKSESAA